MHLHGDGRLRRAPLLPGILVIPEQFLLLRVHRNHRPRDGERPPHLLVDVPELRVTIRVIRPLVHLPRPLQAVVQLPQQLGDLLVADGMAVRGELGRQCPRTLAGPAQRRLGIAPGQRIDQRLEATRQVGIARDQRRPPAARATHPPGGSGGLIKFRQPFRDRDPRQPAGAAHERDAAMSELSGFIRRQQPPRTFVQMRPEPRHSVLQGAGTVTGRSVCHAATHVNVIY